MTTVIVSKLAFRAGGIAQRKLRQGRRSGPQCTSRCTCRDLRSRERNWNQPVHVQHSTFSGDHAALLRWPLALRRLFQVGIRRGLSVAEPADPVSRSLPVLNFRKSERSQKTALRVVACFDVVDGCLPQASLPTAGRALSQRASVSEAQEATSTDFRELDPDFLDVTRKSSRRHWRLRSRARRQFQTPG